MIRGRRLYLIREVREQAGVIRPLMKQSDHYMATGLLVYERLTVASVFWRCSPLLEDTACSS